MRIFDFQSLYTSVCVIIINANMEFFIATGGNCVYIVTESDFKLHSGHF